MLSKAGTVDLITHVAAKTQNRSTKNFRAPNRALTAYGDVNAEDKQRAVINRSPTEENAQCVAVSQNTASLLHYTLSPIDQYEHFSRIKAVLTYSDRHGKWIGLKNFINLYFSTVFHSFFGEQVDMHLIHVEKRKKFCAHFSLRSARAYRIIIMLNYRLWDKILLSASALPDLYFQSPDRSYLEKAAVLHVPSQSCHLGQPDGQSSTTSSVANNTDTASSQTAKSDKWYEVSVSALCLIHRLEMIMFNDLRSNNAAHVVTLGKFFANHNDIKNPFVVSQLYD